MTTDSSFPEDSLYQSKYLTFGLKSGNVVFVNAYNLKKIYARFCAAQDSVIMFKEVFETNSFICLTESLHLSIQMLEEM